MTGWGQKNRSNWKGRATIVMGWGKEYGGNGVGPGV